MEMKKKDWGVVSKLELEADTFVSLKAACIIALTEHKAEGFKVNPIKPNEVEILWATGGDLGGTKFLSPINDPEELAEMIWKWLSETKRYDNSKQHDTDGDLEKGFKISMSNLSGWNVMFKVIPEYIIYGK